MEPLTGRQGVSHLIVYGSLRLVRTFATRREALSTALTGYCRQHEPLPVRDAFTPDVAGRSAPRGPGTASRFRCSSGPAHVADAGT